MKNVLFIFCLIPVLFSCRSEKKPEKFFSEVKEIKGKTFLPGAGLMDPRQLAVWKEYLVVINNRSEPLIELYDRQNRKRVRRFLSIGKGPSEVGVVGQLQRSGPDFYVSGVWEGRVLKCSLEEVLKDSAYLPEPVFSRDELAEEEGAAGPFLLGKEVVIGGSNNPEGRLMIIDKKTKSCRYTGVFPPKEQVDARMDDVCNAKLYASSMVMSPKGTYVALSAFSAGMIDIFKVEGTDVVPVWSYADFYPGGIEFMEGPNNSLQPVYTQESRNGYITSWATDRYLYALYSGKKLSDKSYAVSDRVQVVRWDGKETFEYRLDRPVKGIAVSEDDRFLFGIGSNDEMEPEIFQFKL